MVRRSDASRAKLRQAMQEWMLVGYPRRQSHQWHLNKKHTRSTGGQGWILCVNSQANSVEGGCQWPSQSEGDASVTRAEAKQAAVRCRHSHGASGVTAQGKVNVRGGTGRLCGGTSNAR